MTTTSRKAKIIVIFIAIYKTDFWLTFTFTSALIENLKNLQFQYHNEINSLILGGERAKFFPFLRRRMRPTFTCNSLLYDNHAYFV